MFDIVNIKLAFTSVFLLVLSQTAFSSELPLISQINKGDGAPKAHGRASVVDGKLLTIFAPDSGKEGGGFALFDISNFKHPKLVTRIENQQSYPLREAHGFGFLNLRNQLYLIAQASYGFQIWNLTNLNRPELTSEAKLPQIQASDYSHGAWWLSVAYPLVYLGGSANGIYIIDISDPKNPFLVERQSGMDNPIPTGQLGGFRTGPVFAIGNRLAFTSMDETGLGYADITTPQEPQVIKAQKLGVPKVYSSMFVNGMLLLAGADEQFYTYSTNEDDPQFKQLGQTSIHGKGGYLSYQNGIAYVGSSNSFNVIDLNTPNNLKLLNRTNFTSDKMDWDFATAVGSHIVVSDDHGYGSFIYQNTITGLDNTPPEIERSFPGPGEKLSVRPNIGLSFSENLDPGKTDMTKIYFSEIDGTRIDAAVSINSLIVNISPESQLKNGKTYTVTVEKGAVKDFSGHPNEAYFEYQFETFAENPYAPSCSIQGTEIVDIDHTGHYFAELRNMPSHSPIHWVVNNTEYPVKTSSMSIEFKSPGAKQIHASIQVKEQVISCDMTTTVVYPISHKRPIHTSTMALDYKQSLVWNVNPDNHTVSAISMNDFTKVLEIKVGKNPKSLAFDYRRSILWVANYGEHSLSIIDTTTLRLIHTIKLAHGSYPFGILVSSNGEFVYVSLYGKNSLLRINTNLESLGMQSVNLGPFPGPMVEHPESGTLWINRFISDKSYGEIYRVDTNSFKTRKSVMLQHDIKPDREDQGRGLPNYLAFSAISPDGRQLIVPATKDNIKRGQYLDGQNLNFESTVRAITTSIDLTRVLPSENIDKRLDLNDRALPFAIGFTNLGEYTFITLLGSNMVEVRDSYTGDLVAAIENIPAGPMGIAVDSFSQHVFVHSFLDRSISTYDIKDLRQHKKITHLATTQIVEHEQLTELELLGKQVFYNAKDPRMNKDGYISCASCHLDGGHDGQTWDFTDRGEGLRNTITLQGRSGTGHGRVHWTGNFDEIQDFEHDIRNGFGGAGFMADNIFLSENRNQTLGGQKAGHSPELDALAAYVSSLDQMPDSPYRNQDGTVSPEANKGKIVFQKAGCESCHQPSQFTDSTLTDEILHDVGTITKTSGQRLGAELTGFDTPTLRGLWQTAPYLHDGAAANILEVFDSVRAGDGHREFNDLTQDEKNHLLQYLLELE